MRGLVLLGVDLLLILVATIGALVLRNNLLIYPQKLEGLLPYLAMTLVLAVPVLLGFGLNRSIWRLSALQDYLRVVAAASIIVILATMIGFLVNRLEGVSRSLPVIQWVLIAVTLIGARVLSRLRYAARQQSKKPRTAAVTSIAELPGARETVLIAGLNRVAELYLESLAEFGADHITIAGLLGRSDRHSGRLIMQHKVWGTTADIADILPELETHGLFVSRIVVTTPKDRLGSDVQDALLKIGQTTDIEIDFFAERLFFSGRGGDRTSGRPEASQQQRKVPESQDVAARFSIPALEPAILQRRIYWHIKRALDVVTALLLIVLFSPLTLLTALLVAVDLGSAVVFRQQRPGLGGHPFQLLKFATMAPPRDLGSQQMDDDARTSAIGHFVRRFRLDELPQLFNILKGDMSFIGPRPLLPRDQPAAFAARLLVRPGLTGWAQIRGGREVAPADKAALDVWYVQHASLRLDLEILLRTIPVVILGERADSAAVRSAWDDLRKAGICC